MKSATLDPVAAMPAALQSRKPDRLSDDHAIHPDTLRSVVPDARAQPVQSGGHPARTAACLNCATSLAGPFCHACGQHALHMPRSLPELAADMLEMMTHADGKLWRTLRRLAFAPGTLTRDFIAGRRAAEIPPIRMFFIALLAIFTLSSFLGTGRDVVQPVIATLHAPRMAETRDHVRQAIMAYGWAGHPRITAWYHAHTIAALDDPAAMRDAMGEWSERLALLLPPITACILWLLYLAPRRVALFDHAIFALHSLTAAIGLLGLAMILDRILPARIVWFADLFLVGIAAIHLFAHLRGLHGGHPVAVVARMFVLAIATIAACISLAVALTVIGLQFAIG